MAAGQARQVVPRSGRRTDRRPGVLVVLFLLVLAMPFLLLAVVLVLDRDPDDDDDPRQQRRGDLVGAGASARGGRQRAGHPADPLT